ncbi:MAG TPA: winged helix-turn-helix domain-containing protein [Croceibacterium sp.]|nr:winged helix-turn-helix domain-containing protein [Croceibacterium sp.]
MDIACLGTRTLQPHRQMLAGGERVALGKRALEVISILAQARGQVVTKEELLDAVWPNTIVEENALQAQIVALRKALGPDADRLKTIRGVGYRLDLGGTAEAPAAVMPVPDLRARNASIVWSPSRIAGLVTLALAVAGGAWTASNVRSNLGEMIRLQALTANGGPEARLLADSVGGEIVNVLNESGIETRRDAASGGFSLLPQSDWRLAGGVLQHGARLVIDVRFEDVPTGTILWSRRFEGRAGSLENLATEAAAATARTVYTAQELKLQKDIRVDPATVALHLRASELVRGRQLGGEATPREIYARIAAREPRLAHAHAMMALSTANEMRTGSSAVNAELSRLLRREAATAIDLDPAGAGAAYDALYALARLEHPRDYRAAERWLLEGLRSAPGFAFLAMRECRLLMGVGRAHEALRYCQRGLAQHPYAEPIRHSYASALWSTGDFRSADDAIQRAATLAPDHAITAKVRFELASFGANSREALKLLDDPATRPSWLQPGGVAAVRRFLARDDLRAGAHDELAAELNRLAGSGEIAIDWSIMALTALGRNDLAFGLLRTPEVGEALHRGGVFLFAPVTRPLRADPRFFDLAADLGIAQYWVSNGTWPDMCGEEMAAEPCQSRIRAALARLRSNAR